MLGFPRPLNKAPMGEGGREARRSGSQSEGAIRLSALSLPAPQCGWGLPPTHSLEGSEEQKKKNK